jgi:hypothetical protein
VHIAELQTKAPGRSNDEGLIEINPEGVGAVLVQLRNRRENRKRKLGSVKERVEQMKVNEHPLGR